MSKNKRIINDDQIALLDLHYENIFERGVNFKERIITITGPIEYPLFDILDAAMTHMEAENNKPITIKLHSQGGNVYEALAVVGRITKSECEIICEGYGQVMSAATLILACGDSRKFSEFGWFMHHEASYEVSGKHSEIKDQVTQTEDEEKRWAMHMARFTKKSKNFWMKTGVRVDKYLTAKNLLKYGVIDEII